MDHASQFQKDGFLVLPGFFERDHIDEVVRSINRTIDARPKNVVVDMLETGSRTRLSSLTADQVRAGRMKVNDLYLTMDNVRQLAINARLANVLNACMGAPVALCNSLYFEKGSAQPPHVDAIYMTPATHGHLLASWVALEDVHVDAGPLEYFPGSHLIPQWKFSDGSYHFVPEEMAQWHAYMDEQIAERGLQKTSFAARKGDVFIWHAHLLHGGGPINDASRTRKSLVFHYYTECDSRARRLKTKQEGPAFWIDRPAQEVPGELTVRGILRQVKRALA
ncbi:phytanoyl-CoA dioxygenase family protein [Paraburkholderia tropica]|uniref:phytanoyl-CoA dioxygenase family protein n=1 Tax=Paraburkholderia tropica TaxID=92647 RepID=UPI003D2D1EE2